MNIEYINSLLPPVNEMSLRNEVDRFGFSSILANKLNKKKVPRALCNWTHGWRWWEIDNQADIIHGSVRRMRNTVCVVTNTQQKNFLCSLGYKKVYVGGLPFAYVEKPKINRIQGATIVMMPKSQAENDIHSSFFKYVDFIRSNKQKFGDFVLCIFGGDAKRNEIVSYLNKYKLPYIIGATSNDRNGMRRMATIFSIFENCLSGTIGSHFIYAGLMGAKCGIIGPFYSPMSKGNVYNNNSIYCTELYSKKHYNWLFINSYCEAKNIEDWAKKESGTDFILKNEDLKSVLGWSFFGLVKHLLSRISL